MTIESAEPKVKKVFICSPFSPKGETAEEMTEDLIWNITQVQKACMYAAYKGYVPYAPHLYFTQFLDDGDREEREYGQTLGLTWLFGCDELWVIGRRIGRGMLKEIEQSEKWGIPVKHYVGRRTKEERLLDAIFHPEIEIKEMI